MTTASEPTEENASGPNPEQLNELVDRYPWVDRFVRVGWLSRGVVYLVVGLTAMSVSLRRAPADDEASPSGALGQIAEAPAGRLILAVLLVGMVLYIGFQIFSLALVRGNGVFRWWRRAGHVVATLFYSMFAWSTAQVVISGNDSSGSSLIERTSSAVLQNTAGRWLLGLAGVVTIGVGVYFVARHAVQRGFAQGLSRIDDAPDDNDAHGGAILFAGVVGWVGRSLVIMLIGFFVLRAAVTFDPTEARGFDRALRQTAGSTIGSWFVLACGLGLVSYGVFCVASHRHRTIRDNESES